MSASRASHLPVRFLHLLTTTILILTAFSGPAQPALASESAEPLASGLADTLPPEPTPIPAQVSAPPLPATPVSAPAELVPAALPRLAAARSLTDGTGEETATVTPAGAAVSFLDGRVTVIAEAGAFAEAVTLRMQPKAAAPQAQLAATPIPDSVETPDWRGPEEAPLRFTLEAAAGGQAVAEFAKPVQIVVDLRGLPGLEPDSRWFLAYRDADDLALWHEVETTAYDPAGLLGANVTHFSDWSGGDLPAGWLYRWRPPSVSPFSGAAT